MYVVWEYGEPHRVLVGFPQLENNESVIAFKPEIELPVLLQSLLSLFLSCKNSVKLPRALNAHQTMTAPPLSLKIVLLLQGSNPGELVACKDLLRELSSLKV